MYLLWLTICATVVAGCASAGGPPCERLSVRQAIVKTGSVPGPFNAKNKQFAMNAALVSAMTPLGLKVSFNLEARETEILREGKGGQESTFKSRTDNVVKASFDQVEIRGMRENYCVEQGNVKARVIIPETEWARLHRIARKRTVLVYRCTAEIAGACTSDNLADAKAAARAAGLSISAVETSKVDLQDNQKRLVRLGLKHGAALVLWLNLEGRDLGIVEGNQVTATAMQINLVETSDQKVRASFSSGTEARPYKVLVPLRYMKPVQAARKSMKRALLDDEERSLRQQLANWRTEGMLTP
jgi:hypothetical protein